MPSIIESEEEKLPPFWGASYWWTRSGALIGLLSLLTGMLMVWLLGQHVGQCGLPNLLTEPTLAIEVAGSWADVAAMTGPCQATHCGQSTDAPVCRVETGCKTICPDKVAALTAEQYQDFCFIVIYWLFFLYLGVANWKFCYWARLPLVSQVLGKVGGAATIAAGTWGALNDWRENREILLTLGGVALSGGPSPVMRDLAYEKWRLLFLAIGAASPLFLFWTGRTNTADARSSAFSQLLAWTTAVLAVSTAWTGFAACLEGDDHRLEVATGGLDLVILSTMLTLATAQLWRGGTLAALNRLARLPLLRFLATLFSSEVAGKEKRDKGGL